MDRKVILTVVKMFEIRKQFSDIMVSMSYIRRNKKLGVSLEEQIFKLPENEKEELMQLIETFCDNKAMKYTKMLDEL